VTSGGNSFNDFTDNKLTKFRVFVGWSRILSPAPGSHLKFLRSIAVRYPIGWTPLADTTDKETTDGQTRLFVSPSVRSFVFQMEFDADRYCSHSSVEGAVSSTFTLLARLCPGAFTFPTW